MAKRVRWTIEARADVRGIDRNTALRPLKALNRFLMTEAGDVKQLEWAFHLSQNREATL